MRSSPSTIGVEGKEALLAGLTAEFSARFTQSITFSDQQEYSEEIELNNDSAGLYRVFAIWKRVQVAELLFPDVERTFSRENLFIRHVGPVRLNSDGGVTVVATEKPM